MDPETKTEFDGIRAQLRELQTAVGEQKNFRAEAVTQRDKLKADLLTNAASGSTALWAQVKLIPGRKQSSKDPQDYEISIESKTGWTADERWKLDVNDRYQKAVNTVISLSTAALGIPFVFLKDIHESILHVLTTSAYVGTGCLALSILTAVVYYFFSAKWVKLALIGKADFFGIKFKKQKPVEVILDFSYFFMMIGFLVGVSFMFYFMATYVPK
jgi:hypothetical protein